MKNTTYSGDYVIIGSPANIKAYRRAERMAETAATLHAMCEDLGISWEDLNAEIDREQQEDDQQEDDQLHYHGQPNWIGHTDEWERLYNSSL